MSPFAGLQPAPVWRHFQRLCAIPRPSGKEAQIRDEIRAWAGTHGIDSDMDATGNLLLRKPPSAGMEQMPGIVLQGHLDMVCQANRDTPHDFLHDPIVPQVQDGWLACADTTLGADNGIGVALALAALEDDSLRHGPLEVLLTVDEEAGMTGARGLQPGWLQGKLMLNLDTEDWGEFYIGCAGGMDLEVQLPLVREPVPADMQTWELGVSGLRGGHSGVDIHLGRGNAIRILLRTLRRLSPHIAIRLHSVQGGSARNALPREAQATISLPATQTGSLNTLLVALQAELQSELGALDPALRLTLQPHPEPIGQVLTAHSQQALIDLFLALPYGVRRMSAALPGVVETSNNLGVMACDETHCQASLMLRSLIDSAALALAEDIEGLVRMSDATVRRGQPYPGWQPEADAPLLAHARASYAQLFGDAPEIKVIHAGLECGLIGAHYPGLQMVSFGPTIRGAHAPGERVEIASVERTYTLLKALLSGLPGQSA